MNRSLTLYIKSPDKLLHEEHEITSMRLPLIDGNLGIRPGHAPLVAEVESGSIQYLKEGIVEFVKIDVSAGLLRIEDDIVNILCVDQTNDQEDLMEEFEFDALSGELLKLLYEQPSEGDVDEFRKKTT